MLFLFLLLGGLAAHWLLPIWWSIVPVALLCGYFGARRGGQAFRSGFFANALLWLGLIVFDLVTKDMSLAVRGARLLFLPNWECLVLVTALIGGLCGGFACLCGWQMSRLFFSRIIT
jgi:hypothetical protein